MTSSEKQNLWKNVRNSTKSNCPLRLLSCWGVHQPWDKSEPWCQKRPEWGIDCIDTRYVVTTTSLWSARIKNIGLCVCSCFRNSNQAWVCGFPNKQIVKCEAWSRCSHHLYWRHFATSPRDSSSGSLPELVKFSKHSAALSSTLPTNSMSNNLGLSTSLMAQHAWMKASCDIKPRLGTSNSMPSNTSASTVRERERSCEEQLKKLRFNPSNAEILVISERCN